VRTHEREFQSAQERYFADADQARFRWTTQDPAFAGVEDALIVPWLRQLPFPCLEVGCGEGTNLARLVRWGMPIGVDRFGAKARFAAAAVPGARIATADALALPFATGTFAGVLVRDLFHHLGDARRAAAEAVRVLRPGGMLLVLEANGRNPIVALQALLVPAERALRTFTPESVLDALSDLPLDDVRVVMAQGLPLRRLVLHYRFGVQWLGRSAASRAALAGLERAGERLLPQRRWSYTVVTARRR
jgi:SAM-dependent methyltransferase